MAFAVAGLAVVAGRMPLGMDRHVVAVGRRPLVRNVVAAAGPVEARSADDEDERLDDEDDGCLGGGADDGVGGGRDPAVAGPRPHPRPTHYRKTRSTNSLYNTLSLFDDSLLHKIIIFSVFTAGCCIIKYLSLFWV